MYPHRIHLRGPWECEPLARTRLHADGRLETLDGPLPPPCRMTMPCRWRAGGLGDFAGRVRLRRRFQWPGQLDYYERLWLVCAGSDYDTTIWLNEDLLGRHTGAFTRFEFDITARVQRRNQLTVEVELPALAEDARDRQWMLRGSVWCPQASGGLWGDVAVEVRREPSLRNVRTWATFAGSMAVLHVAGELAGTWDRPVELYALLDGATALYERLAPRPGTNSFHLAADQAEVGRWQPRGQGTPRLYDLQIELIDAASKLHAVPQLFGFREIIRGDNPGQLIVNGQELTLAAEGKEANLVVSDVTECDTMLGACERAARAGQMVWVKLPLKGGYACDQGLRAEAVRQVQGIVTQLQSQPAIVGWTCHEAPQAHDADLDDAILQAAAELDATRPIKRQ